MLRYSRGIAVLISLSILCLSGCAGTTANRGGEKVVSLNGTWRFTADRKNEGMDANGSSRNMTTPTGSKSKFRTHGR